MTFPHKIARDAGVLLVSRISFFVFLLPTLILCSDPLAKSVVVDQPDSAAASSVDPSKHFFDAVANANIVANSPSQKYSFSDFDTNVDQMISRDEFNSKVLPLLPPKTFRGGTDDAPGTSFWNAFVSSFASIGATEIGDKTFFIAAVLSMKEKRMVVFSGAFGALVIMTILSTLMGMILPSLLPRKYTHVAAGLLFLYFGGRLLFDSANTQSAGPSEELEEVEGELLKKDEEQIRPNDDEEAGTTTSPPVSGAVPSVPPVKSVSAYSNTRKVLVQAFMMTFLAEWGDRSQIATIALGAAKDPIGVTLGGCAGHGLCTGAAVIGGRILAARISEKTVFFWGGSTFFVFGVHSLFFEV